MTSDKMITHILLQNNYKIQLKDDKKFPIWDTNNHSEFKISSIPDSEFNIEITDIKPKLYYSIFLDNRIKYIKQIKYKKAIYSVIKKSIAEYLQHDNNIQIKEYILKQLENEGKTISQKRKELYSIINEIFKQLFMIENIDQEEFNKIDIDNIDSICKEVYGSKCSNSICHYVSPKSITNISKEDVHESILLFNLKNRSILEDIDKLKKFLKSVNETITNKTNDELRKQFIDHHYTKYILKKYNTALLTNIKDIINDIRKNTVSCKLKIFSLNSNKVININLKNNLLNHFLEEIIRNKFKRFQIFDNIQFEISDEKFIYDEKYEILLRDEDISVNRINEIYKNVKNSFYNNINLFDYNYKSTSFLPKNDKFKNIFTQNSCNSNT